MATRRATRGAEGRERGPAPAAAATSAPGQVWEVRLVFLTGGVVSWRPWKPQRRCPRCFCVSVDHIVHVWLVQVSLGVLTVQYLPEYEHLEPLPTSARYIALRPTPFPKIPEGVFSEDGSSLACAARSESGAKLFPTDACFSLTAAADALSTSFAPRLAGP